MEQLQANRVCDSLYECVHRTTGVINHRECSMKFELSKKAVFTLLIASAVLTGCKEKIEASSPEILEASLQKISKDLDPVEKVKLKEAYQSAVIYTYAKNHDGRTPEDAFVDILNQALAGMSGKHVDTSADEKTNKDLLQLLDGKTADDVIDEKTDWDKKTAELRNAWKEKVKVLQAQRQKEQEAQQAAQRAEYARQRFQQTQQQLLALNNSISNIKASVEHQTEKKSTFEKAVSDYPKVEIQKVSLVKYDKGAGVEFDLKNGTERNFKKADIYFELIAGEKSSLRKPETFVFDGSGLSAGDTTHVTYKFSRSDIIKYGLENVDVKVKLLAAYDMENNIKVCDNLDDSGWHRWWENGLNGDRQRLDALVSQKTTVEKLLADMQEKN